jgi:hypothetical protein
MREGFFGGGDLGLTRADIDRIPYACIAVRAGSGDQSLVILADYDGPDLDWVSHARQLIKTRRGRVVRTVGLDADLDHTSFVTPDPVGTKLVPGTTYECARVLDFGKPPVMGIPVHSHFVFAGEEMISILDRNFRAARWDESGAANGVDWNYVNSYWIDPESGFVRKSLQSICPDLDPLEIIIYRPAQTA